LLNAALTHNMEESKRTAIFYALDVLNSDSVHSSIPVGLNPTKCGSRRLIVESCTGGSVLRWLMTSYAPIQSDDATNSPQRR
jgi:hypothetical protein